MRRENKLTVENNSNESPLLDIRNIKQYFPVKNHLGRIKGYVKAVNDVSFQLFGGETYGLVGESGCGKSTIARTLLRLLQPVSGEVIYNDFDIFKMGNEQFREFRKEIQMVFQDPYSSLNPKKRIGEILEEPLKIHKIGNSALQTERVMDILDKVGLPADCYYRFPHEFSGGQRQRIGLARALILQPKLIILDEPVSALDVSIQSQILNLLKEIQREFKLTYLFISHDLSVIRHLSDRIGVMYLGELVEEAETDNIYSDPLHPYTKALMSAIPKPNPRINNEKIYLEGEIPSAIDPPTGCFFHTRCPYAKDICKKIKPLKKEYSQDHFVACHLYSE